MYLCISCLELDSLILLNSTSVKFFVCKNPHFLRCGHTSSFLFSLINVNMKLVADSFKGFFSDDF